MNHWEYEAYIRGHTGDLYDQDDQRNLGDYWTLDQSRALQSHRRIYDSHADVYAKNAIKKSAHGKMLYDFAEKSGVVLRQSMSMPNNTLAHYVHGEDTLHPGVVEYACFLTPAILGHEYRHAWQHLNGLMAIPVGSPEEMIMRDRFIEADARAFEFATAVEYISATGVKNNYARCMLGAMEGWSKEILHYSEDEVMRLGQDADALKQAMRHVFDRWISLTPLAETYNNLSLGALERTRKPGMLSRLFKGQVLDVVFDLLDPAAPADKSFQHRGVTPAFVDDLVTRLGQMDEAGHGNYLTQTTGLAFTHAFYTRVHDFRLERSAASLKI